MSTTLTCLDMKSIVEVYHCDEAQSYINDGWYLLGVGTCAGTGGTGNVENFQSGSFYILGNPKECEATDQVNTKLSKFIKHTN